MSETVHAADLRVGDRVREPEGIATVIVRMVGPRPSAITLTLDFEDTTRTIVFANDAEVERIGTPRPAA